MTTYYIAERTLGVSLWRALRLCGSTQVEPHASLRSRKPSGDARNPLASVRGGCQVIHYENDSFGQDGMCLCEECHLAAQRELDQQEVSCADCHKVFASKDLLAWVPYDYYPRDGDQPIYVCGHCQTEPRHQKRVLVNTQRQLEDDSW